MRVLLDHCVPKPFGRLLSAHDVKTAAQMGWSQLRNGRLLAEAARAFDAFITVDKNLKHQQNLQTLPLPVIALDCVSNTPATLTSYAPWVDAALPKLRPGQLIEIDGAGRITEIAPGR